MEYVHLIGSEKVETAGYTMRSAAGEMNSAASNLAYTLENHQRFMTDWLDRFENIVGQLILSGK